MKGILVAAVFLRALAVAVLAGTQGFGACPSAGTSQPLTAAAAEVPTPAHADIRVPSVGVGGTIAGPEVLNTAQARRALALAILLGGNARHDSTN
jgi:hypothetical protein